MARVRRGEIPHPNDLPCVDCGHRFPDGGRLHEYDHHLGYSAEHHLDVQAVCKLCHAQRTARSDEGRGAGQKIGAPRQQIGIRPDADETRRIDAIRAAMEFPVSRSGIVLCAMREGLKVIERRVVRRSAPRVKP